MDGGEVARDITKHGTDQLPSVAPDRRQPRRAPDHGQTAHITADRTKGPGRLLRRLHQQFFSVNGVLKVTEGQRQVALARCQEAERGGCSCVHGHHAGPTRWGLLDGVGRRRRLAGDGLDHEEREQCGGDEGGDGDRGEGLAEGGEGDQGCREDEAQREGHGPPTG